MKTLLVLRHAKSSWKDPDLPDHDRPLNKRGKKDAPVMGKLIGKKKLTPDWILSSTAVRAMKTAESAAETSKFSGEIQFEEELYLARPSTIIELIQKSAPKSAETILIVGHNPGFEELVGILAGQKQLFPTAALAQIELAVERWDELTPKTKGRLIHLWRPKELAGESTPGHVG
ncbi:MAG: histidine phosphatase family protein [Vicinamibacteria bacterium]